MVPACSSMGYNPCMEVPSFGVLFFTTGRVEPRRHVTSLVSGALACEQAGFGLVLLDGRGGGRDDRLDTFSLLGGLASKTSQIRLGALVAADERAPALLAKATSTLDVCSKGRAVLILAPPIGLAGAEALEVLEEAVAVVRAMFCCAAPSVEGRHITVAGAWNEPRAFAGPPPVGIALPARLRAKGAEALASWAVRPDFALVDLEAHAPIEDVAKRASPRAEHVPLWGCGPEPNLPALREAGYGGAVWMLGQPEEASLERLEGFAATIASWKGEVAP
jgi:alkanesulfonate monooxygenase SsuD/methylene tetrahydromethanopterin reductase-like flavin-dependent oxidoreductase (luciferase family)